MFIKFYFFLFVIATGAFADGPFLKTYAAILMQLNTTIAYLKNPTNFPTFESGKHFNTLPLYQRMGLFLA